ncbi:hypothetical protein JTB14_031078 [Gonioctena quinquepunctata]|nr:hypothetical protein JTB14_031078 [Gonioctena quinquepunctata]
MRTVEEKSETDNGGILDVGNGKGILDSTVPIEFNGPQTICTEPSPTDSKSPKPSPLKMLLPTIPTEKQEEAVSLTPKTIGTTIKAKLPTIPTEKQEEAVSLTPKTIGTTIKAKVQSISTRTSMIPKVKSSTNLKVLGSNVTSSKIYRSPSLANSRSTPNLAVGSSTSSQAKTLRLNDIGYPSILRSIPKLNTTRIVSKTATNSVSQTRLVTPKTVLARSLPTKSAFSTACFACSNPSEYQPYDLPCLHDWITLFLLNIILGCCSKYSGYWNDRHTGNRWIVSLWTATPHQQPALDYTELQDISVPSVPRQHVIYHHPPETPPPQEFLELKKRESDI